MNNKQQNIENWANIYKDTFVNESKRKIHSTSVTRDHIARDGSYRVDVTYDCGDKFTKEGYTGFSSKEASKRYEKKILSGVNEDLDDSSKKELDEIVKFCDKEMKKYSLDKSRFQEFAFEGQALKSIWYCLKTGFDLLKDENKSNRALDYLGRALTNLSDVDGHKRPQPTDPRDIK